MYRWLFVSLLMWGFSGFETFNPATITDSPAAAETVTADDVLTTPIGATPPPPQGGGGG